MVHPSARDNPRAGGHPSTSAGNPPSSFLSDVQGFISAPWLSGLIRGHTTPDLATEDEQRLRYAIQRVVSPCLSLPQQRDWPGLLFKALLVNPLFAAWDALVATATSPRTHRFVLRILIALSLYTISLFFATIAYIGFTKVWTPHVGSKKAVWLQYG